MKFDHIRTFLEIAASGSFSRTAENLNVTQSTVSGRVRAMEEQLGRPLFRRGHAGVELTSAGQRFRRYAEGIERLWQQSQQQVALPEGYRTVLALGAQVSLWERLILDWMPRMRRQAPTVALQVQADYSHSLMRQLADGLLDICVMYQPRQIAGLVIEDLFEETLVMAAKEPRDVSAGLGRGLRVRGLGGHFPGAAQRSVSGYGNPRGLGGPRRAGIAVHPAKRRLGIFSAAHGGPAGCERRDCTWYTVRPPHAAPPTWCTPPTPRMRKCWRWPSTLLRDIARDAKKPNGDARDSGCRRFLFWFYTPSFIATDVRVSGMVVDGFEVLDADAVAGDARIVR